MNNYKFLIFTSLFYSLALNANPTEMLFRGIQESDMAMVLDALNDGADINATQETGYQDTPLMAALETLHNRIVNTHDTKRILLTGSFLTGVIAGSYGYCKTDNYTKKTQLNPNAKLAINSTCGIGAVASTTYLCNRILNRIFTNSSNEKIANAYLIVEILLEQPEINVSAVNTITGQTAHQMVGNFIIHVPSLIPHSHPCSSWHIIHANDTLLKKLLAFGIVLGIDTAVHSLDYSILKDKIDTVFVPIAQQIAKKA